MHHAEGASSQARALELLKVSDVVRGQALESDVVARIGDDRFALMCFETVSFGAGGRDPRRVVATLAGHPSLGAGLARWTPVENPALDDLLKSAAAMCENDRSDYAANLKEYHLTE